MFEQSILPRGKAWKRIFGAGLSMTGEAILLVIAVLVPIVSPEILPTRALQTWVLPTPPRRVAHVEPHTIQRGNPIHAQFHESRLWLPVSIPQRTPIIIDEPVDIASGPGVPGGIEGAPQAGLPSSLTDSILKDALRPAPYVKPAEPAPAAARKPDAEPPKRIHSGVEPAYPIYRPNPQYPAMARQARISGVVELLGVVGVDGRMKELKVLRGHPLLVNAAVEAVRQWVYKPTLLNGQPVEVEAPIVVTFTLN